MKPLPFTGHLGYIWSLLKLNDNTLLSGGRDKAIKVWDSKGTLINVLKGHENSVLCMEKIAAGLFITGSRDQQVIVWKDFAIINTIKNHSAVVLSLCRINDNTFASASGDHTVQITGLDGTIARVFTAHTNWVWQVIQIDEWTLASCSEDCTIKIWRTDAANTLCTFRETAAVFCLAYNKKTRTLISGNFAGEISVRILGEDFQQQHFHSFKAHEGIVRTVVFIDEQRMASGGEDNQVRIWTTGGREIASLAHQNFVQALCMLDAQTLLSASYDGTIGTWSV